MSDDAALFRALVERASDLALLADAEGRMLYVSPAVAYTFGYDAEDVERLLGFDFIHPDDLESRRDVWERLVRSPSGTIEVSRFRIRHADGSWRHVEQRATNLLDDPDVRGIAASVRDITETVEATEALASSHTELQRLGDAQQHLIERYRTAVEAAGLGVWEYNRAARELIWAADTDLGARAATGGLEPGPHHVRDLVDLIHPDDVPAWLRIARSALDLGESFSLEFRVLLPGGERRWQLFGRPVELYGRPRVVGTVRDVTELRAAEERLRSQQEELARAQRFASMGELAAGLAHDVGNLMTVVAGRADLLAMRLGEDDEDVAELAATARRGRELLHRVTSFAQGGRRPDAATDVVRAVRGIAASAPQLLGPQVQLDLVLDETVPSVAMAAADLDQVLLNLCVNGALAMPDGGHLTIAVRALRDDDDGDRVEVEVADRGVGIPADLLPRVFEPFVTTRTRQGGTGLGLSIVYRLVSEAGGRVDIDSQVGKGTTVRLALPGSSDAG